MSIHKGTGFKSLLDLTADKACDKYITLEKKKQRLRKDKSYQEAYKRISQIEREQKDYKKFIVRNAKQVSADVYELLIAHKTVPSYAYDQIVVLKHREQVLLPLKAS